MSELTQTQTGLEGRVQQLRDELAGQDTAVLAERCGASWENGRMQMNVWDTAVSIDLFNFIACNVVTGTELDLLLQGVIAYYLHTSDGIPAANTWIAFTDLPDGRFYTQAFQGYTGQELAHVFGNDVRLFAETAGACGGTAVPFGDTAFRFQALPRVPLLVVCWQGDEDFPTLRPSRS